MQSQLGLSLSHHFINQSDLATSTLREALSTASDSSSTAQLDLTLQLAKLLFATHGKSAVEEMKELLFANISGETVHVPSILALAVLGLASDDADLLDAAQSELESLLSSGVASVDSVVRLLVAVKTLTGSQGGVDALTLVHDTIQATIGRKDRDQRSLFNLHLAYMEHALHLLEQGKELEEEQTSQVLAYAGLTQDLFEGYAGVFPEVEKERARLEGLLGRFGRVFPEQLGKKGRSESLAQLALVDAPWTLMV